MKTKRPFSINVLLFLLLLLSMGALFGGAMLVLDPSGELLQMPVLILEDSPFQNFLIPGLILFILLGILPALVSYSLLKQPQWIWINVLNLYGDMYWGWTFTLYTGFVLIIWISVQTLLINSVHLVHIVYILLGLSIVCVALLPSVRQYYFKRDQK